MKILSLFDGISGCQQALKNLRIIPEKYYASEVDKYAIQITMSNFPDTIQIGDVRNINGNDYKDIDLLIGGSPCQDLSIAKSNRKGLDGEKSGLFWEYVRIKNECNPKYFVLENVASMSKESMLIISKAMGVFPVLINSALLTAQNRKRYYWTNIQGGGMYGEIEQPEDLGILLKDILENGFPTKTINGRAITIGASYQKKGYANIDNGSRTATFVITKPIPVIKSVQQQNRVYSDEGKMISLHTAQGGGHLRILDHYNKRIKTDNKAKTLGTNPQCETSVAAQSILFEDGNIRKLTPIECERLQGFPDNYTNAVSNSQRYKALGNSFTVPVIEHILKTRLEFKNVI